MKYFVCVLALSYGTVKETARKKIRILNITRRLQMMKLNEKSYVYKFTYKSNGIR